MEGIPQSVTDRLSDAQARLAPQIDQARQNLTELEKQASSWIRQNPGTALLGAVAVGFLIGKIAAR